MIGAKGDGKANGGGEDTAAAQATAGGQPLDRTQKKLPDLPHRFFLLYTVYFTV